MPSTLFDLDHITTINLPRHARADGEVVAAEADHVPFALVRMFTLTAPLDARRGQHAHLLCSQFMMCVHGIVDVTCDDGSRRRSFTLDRPDQALIVPPTIWNIVLFRQANSVLVVLCDRPYEANDYIRDYGEFLVMRNAVRA